MVHTSTARSENKLGARTRGAILDAAETLFGRGSYDSVSLRDIAQEAGVLLGAVGHHFKGKEALFRAVATRRADAVNQARLDRLHEIETPTVESVVDAFVRPALELCAQPEWRNYLTVVAQLSQEERWQELDSELFLATALVFVEQLERAQPRAPKAALREGLQHGISVLLSAIGGQTWRLNNLGAGDSPKTIQATDIDHVVSFITGGIVALSNAE